MESVSFLYSFIEETPDVGIPDTVVPHLLDDNGNFRLELIYNSIPMESIVFETEVDADSLKSEFDLLVSEFDVLDSLVPEMCKCSTSNLVVFGRSRFKSAYLSPMTPDLGDFAFGAINVVILTPKYTGTGWIRKILLGSYQLQCRRRPKDSHISNFWQYGAVMSCYWSSYVVKGLFAVKSYDALLLNFNADKGN
ncbi:hypothetical protein OROMI_018908 [Orobanche minor]